MSLVFSDSCIVIDYINGKLTLDNDAIIAATCLIYDLPLWTHNKEDFRYLAELELEE